MVNVAHRSEAASPTIQGTRLEGDRLLLEPDARPKTVYVGFVDSQIGFGTERGVLLTGGIEWNPPTTNTDDLFITFVLEKGITGIAKNELGPGPTLFLSARFEGATEQDACAPMVAEPTTYHFCVDVSLVRHDPIIVVTPQ